MRSMTLRFSDEGPAFPTELVRALLEGDVVLLCGAGISAPQLPGFAGLVNGCFEALGEEKTPAEQTSFDDKRFEETLGTLGRRLVDPEALTEAVCQALQVPADVDLAHHRTVLRLSRDRDGRVLVVTTNFDTLVERALQPSDLSRGVRGVSYAGQALPQPGGARFSGVVHLHGRVEDDVLGLDRTELVVTSADYGDAYMRSGWASRFLFDLARCKTIVLVGYSAGDAPVRYFLNVLEADRERFSDLKAVYALDAASPGVEPDPRWSAVAVEPLPYVAPVNAATGYPDHGALWRDLESLADFVERPRTTRRAMAEGALRRKLDQLTPLERERTLWLFESDESGGLWDIPAMFVEDPAWFDALHEAGLVTADRTWMLAAWCARDFTDEGRFRFAVAWCARLGGRLAAELRRHLFQDVRPPSPLITAWRALTAPEVWLKVDFVDGPYAVTRALAGAEILHEDLRRAVRLLTPFVKVSSRLVRAATTSAPRHAVDLAPMHLTVRESGGVLDELREALAAVARVEALTALATDALRTVVEEAMDVGLIVDDDDATDFSVPAVEDHPQNEHRDGTVFLVTLLSRLLPALAASDREGARRYAEMWRTFPGRTGRRLWLYALRLDAVFSADEAIEGVLQLGQRDFWTGSREMPLVLLGRARDAARPLLDDLERRITAEAPAYFAGFERGSGDVDWRDHAADRAVWFRLRMLADARALSPAGSLSLQAILSRRSYLVRDLEDRDFFSSYLFPVKSVVGDASPIAQAETDDRLHVARTASISPSFEQQQGWSVYCRSEPRAALDTLRGGAFDEKDVGLWRTFLSAAAYLPDESSEERAALAAAIFEALAPAGDTFVAAIVVPLVDVYWVHPGRPKNLEGWWRRLFGCALTHEGESASLADRRRDWLLTPSGRLTQAAMIDVDRLRQAGEAVPQAKLEELDMAAAAGERGFNALAALAHNAAFMLSIEGHEAARLLDAALAHDDVDALDLRSVLVTSPTTTPALSTAFRAHMLRGVVEFSVPAVLSRAVAAKILTPAIYELRKDADRPEWGIDVSDTRRALRNGSSALREGAAGCLADWCAGEQDKAAYWRETVAPLLAAVWPRDKRLKAPGQCLHFVRLVVQAGDAFPEALASVRPHLTVSANILNFIDTSPVPDEWPREALDLLWTTREEVPGTSYFQLEGILDRLRAADPTIEPDRRFQWLELRAPRFR